MATFIPTYNPTTIEVIVNEDRFNLPKITITGGTVNSELGSAAAEEYGFSGSYFASPGDYPRPTFSPTPPSGSVLNWSIDPSDVFKLDIYYLAKSDGIVLIHKCKQLPADNNIVTQPWKTNCDIEADPQTDPVFKTENNFNTITRVVPPKITTRTFIYTFDVEGSGTIPAITANPNAKPPVPGRAAIPISGTGSLVVTVTLKYDSSTLQANLKAALARSLYAQQYLDKHETQWHTRRKTDEGVSDPITPDIPDGELLGHKPASEFMGVKVLNGVDLSKLTKSYYSEQTNQYGIAIKFKVPKDNIIHRKLVPEAVLYEHFTLPDGYEVSISSYAGDWSNSVNQMTLPQSARRSNDFGIIMSSKPEEFTSELMWKKYKVTKGQEYYLNIRSGEPEFSTNVLVVLNMVNAASDNNFINYAPNPTSPPGTGTIVLGKPSNITATGYLNHNDNMIGLNYATAFPAVYYTKLLYLTYDVPIEGKVSCAALSLVPTDPAFDTWILSGVTMQNIISLRMCISSYPMDMTDFIEFNAASGSAESFISSYFTTKIGVTTETLPMSSDKIYKVSRGGGYYLNILYKLVDLIGAPPEIYFHLSAFKLGAGSTGSTPGTYKSIGSANSNFNSMDPVRVLPPSSLTFDGTSGKLIQVTTDRTGVAIPFTIPKNDSVEYWELRGDQTLTAAEEYGPPYATPALPGFIQWAISTHAMGLGVAEKSIQGDLGAVAGITSTGITVRTKSAGPVDSIELVAGQKYYLNLKAASTTMDGTGAQTGARIKIKAWSKLVGTDYVAGDTACGLIGALPITGNDIGPRLPNLYFDINTPEGRAGKAIYFKMPDTLLQSSTFSLKVDIRNFGALIKRDPRYYEGETYYGNTLPSDIAEIAKDLVSGALEICISRSPGDFTNAVTVLGNHTRVISVAAIETGAYTDAARIGPINPEPYTWKNITQSTDYWYFNIRPKRGSSTSQLVTWAATEMNLYPINPMVT